jgi:hypothetical protein
MTQGDIEMGTATPVVEDILTNANDEALSEVWSRLKSHYLRRRRDARVSGADTQALDEKIQALDTEFAYADRDTVTLLRSWSLELRAAQGAER